MLLHPDRRHLRPPPVHPGRLQVRALHSAVRAGRRVLPPGAVLRRRESGRAGDGVVQGVREADAHTGAVLADSGVG